MTKVSILTTTILYATAAAAQPAAVGKLQYQARCVGCHGEDGTGGGHGPSIVDVQRPRATTLSADPRSDPERHSRPRYAGFSDAGRGSECDRGSRDDV